MEEVLMIPKKEFNRLMQYYKGQLLENPLLEKTAALSVEKHHLLKDPSIPPGLKKSMLKPLGRKIHFMKKKLQDTPPTFTAEENATLPVTTPFTVDVPKKDKKKTKPHKSLTDRLRPLPGWEDWAQGRPRKRVRKQVGGSVKRRKKRQ